MFAGFLFNNLFLRRHKFWLHRQFFLILEEETENDGWWFPSSATAGLFEQ